MTLLFFQITDTAHKLIDTANHAALQGAAIPDQELRFGDLLIKGGWVMVPIGILAVLGLVVFFERYFTIRKALKNESNLMMQVRSSIISGNLEAAKAVCRNSNTPLGRMLYKGLNRVGRPIKDIESAIENVGKLEVAALEKNVGILGIVAGIAPMFGFLGTIAGVIKIFYDISKTDNISMGVISGGLYVKMVTSAAGLLVGIVAYIGHHILNIMIDKVIFKLETDAVEFIDLLEEPTK
jgi:biopolymer transport protein ExbB